MAAGRTSGSKTARELHDWTQKYMSSLLNRLPITELALAVRVGGCCRHERD